MSEFWVFRPDYDTNLYRVYGATFIKVGEDQIKRPHSFKTNNNVNGVTPFDKDSSTTEEATTDPLNTQRGQRRRRVVSQNAPTVEDDTVNESEPSEPAPTYQVIETRYGSDEESSDFSIWL